jgi:hypothetical protein
MMVVSGYPPAANAGLERGCERLSRALARRGHSVTVLTGASPGLSLWATDDVGVVVARVLRPWPLGPLWGVSYVFQTALWLWRLRERWDIVLCHQCWIHSIAAAVVGRWLGKASVNLIVCGHHLSDVSRLRAMRGGKVASQTCASHGRPIRIVEADCRRGGSRGC